MTLGQRIQELRKNRGFSQEKLGELLGVSRQAVSKWESDGGIPELDTLIAMSRLFGITIGQLLGVEEPPETEESGRREAVPDVEQMVETVLRRYSEETKKKTRRIPWKRWVVAGLCVLMTAFAVKSWLSGQITLLYNNLDNVGGRVSSLENSLNNRIWTMEREIQDILNEQTNPISNFQWSLAGFDLERETVTLDLQATLKSWTPGTRAQFVLDWAVWDGESGQVQSDWADGPEFHTQVTLPMHDEMTGKLVLTDAEGVVMEQVLGEGFGGLSAEDFQLNLDFWCYVEKMYHGSDWVLQGQFMLESGRIQVAEAELLILEDGEERWRMPLELAADPRADTSFLGIHESIGLELEHNDPEGLTYVLRVTDNLGRVSELVREQSDPGFVPAGREG